MKRTTLAITTLALCLLAACTSSTGVPDDQNSSSSIVQETSNVTYRGTLTSAGITIFQEGTHKLQLDDGRFIMLESADVDLDASVNRKVEVFGAVRPTTEAGGMIMRVQRIAVLDASSSSSAVSSANSGTMTYLGVLRNSGLGDCEVQVRGDTKVISLLNFGAANCTTFDGKTLEVTGTPALLEGQADIAISVTAFREIQPVSSAAFTSASSAAVISSVATSSSSSSSSATPVASSSTAFEGSNELTAKAEIMAKDKMDASFWTQQYCSKTAGFCFPVHKNWYFKSFGATSTTLWHVEVGPQELNNIGEGPLSVNLVSGDISTTGAADAQISGGVGYRAWTENRHIEVRGPGNLSTAINFITTNLKPN